MLIKNSKVLTIGGKWLHPSGESPVPPGPGPGPEPPHPDWNPLNLPPYTVRIHLTDPADFWFDVASRGNPNRGTWRRVLTPEGYPTSMWDCTEEDPNWDWLLAETLVWHNWGTEDRALEHEILGMNSTGVTSMVNFETLAHTKLVGTIPLFDTSSLVNVNSMFYECTNVEGGILDLYNQMSTQTNPPIYHVGTFYECGVNTQTGTAELAQVPSDWKQRS